MATHTVIPATQEVETGFFVVTFVLFCFNCAGFGYIVAFTKVLTMYQTYHT
jgi:hypothetical protein